LTPSHTHKALPPCRPSRRASCDLRTIYNHDRPSIGCEGISTSLLGTAQSHLFGHAPTMRPSPRMLKQRLVHNSPVRVFLHPIPYEAHPPGVLIVRMLSFAGFTATRLILTDKDLRWTRSRNANPGNRWVYDEERAKVQAAAERAMAITTPASASLSVSSQRH